MRSKEEAHDYRYFPDPDLLPLEFDDAFIDAARESLPELPDEKKTRFMEAFGLNDYSAGVLVAEQEASVYFETLVAALAKATGASEGRVAVKASNWLTGDLFGALNKAGKTIADTPSNGRAGCGSVGSC